MNSALGMIGRHALAGAADRLRLMLSIAKPDDVPARTAHTPSDDTAIAAAMDQRLATMRRAYLDACQRLAADPCRPGLVTAADVALRGLQELWLDGESKG